MTSPGPAPRYGEPDEICARHWREAHVDPDKVRAWCKQAGRPAPGRGAIPRELRDAYLAARGHEIPLPGHPTREEAHAALPVLPAPFVVWLGPIQVTYGPCPRCRRPTAAPTGERLPLCLYCQTAAAARQAS
jgi:hypothetical protein